MFSNIQSKKEIVFLWRKENYLIYSDLQYLLSCLRMIIHHFYTYYAIELIIFKKWAIN